MPSQEALSGLFEYDHKTETIYRKQAIVHRLKTGYPRIFFEGRSYFAHRLVWTLVHGPIPPGMQIDHIDRDPLNYRISNLRLVSNTENSYNRYIPIYREDQNLMYDRTIEKWGVYISIRGHRRYFGFFSTKEEARAVRDKALLEKYQDGGIIPVQQFAQVHRARGRKRMKPLIHTPA